MSSPPDPETLLKRLLKSLNIKRIVQVDDVFDETGPVLSSLIAVLKSHLHQNTLTLPPPFDAIDFSAPPEVWETGFQTAWESSEPDAQVAVATEIKRLQEPTEQSDTLVEGYPAQPDLDSLFTPPNDEWEYQRLTPAQWQKDGPGILNSAKDTRTLLLFDLDLKTSAGTADEGMVLIKQALKSEHVSNLELALLSFGFPEDQEIEIAKELCDKHGLAGNEFVPISKERLKQGVAHLVKGVKFVFLNRHRTTITKHTSDVLIEAHKKAVAYLNEMDVFTFEHLIFGSSIEEGAWEPDTLFRVMNTISRGEARTLAKTQPDILETTKKFRNLWSTRIIPSEQGINLAWKYTRREMYEEGSYLNEYHTAIDLGDVFQFKLKFYVLVAQPCDLMLRQDGKRSSFTTEAHLLEILSNIGDRNASHFYKMKCSDAKDGEPQWAALTRSISVRLDVLDLCTGTKTGDASIHMDLDDPPFILEGQLRRYEKLKKHYSEIYDTCKSLEQFSTGTTGSDGELVSKLRKKYILPQGSLTESFGPAVDLEKKLLVRNFAEFIA